ncbi:protein DA1 [Micromonospora palomenae]|uniref:protein DA1 n=1 Tax=Micromonospora palomenae TaxID=1461247 RepID=UPI0014790D2B
MTDPDWRRRRCGPCLLAEAERRRIAEARNPVYGTGFRAARAAAERVGVRRTLQHVRRYGSFP